jgi:hypothetical protein
VLAGRSIAALRYIGNSQERIVRGRVQKEEETNTGSNSCYTDARIYDSKAPPGGDSSGLPLHGLWLCNVR